VRLVWLERVAIAVAALALAVVLISLLSGYFTTRDQASVSGTTEVGLKFADQGDQLLAPGSRHPAYDSNPPTSGPHAPVPVRSDATRLSDDQILAALAAGNVILVYGTPRPPDGLAALAGSVAGPFSSALAATGMAVILARRPGVGVVLGLAWTRMLRVASPTDPLLRQFIQQWLGHGAPRSRRVPAS
jgi:hypothetical protein